MNKIIKIEQENCPPCKMVDNFLKPNNITFQSYDAMEDFEVVERFGIMGTPVTILLNSEEDEIDRVVGFNPPLLEKLISQI